MTMMMPSRLWAALGGALLLAVATGCPHEIPPPNDMMETPEALLEAVEGSSTSVQRARFRDIRLDYFGGPQGRASVNQLLLLQHPDKIRIQTYIPGLDGVAGVLVCACGQFAFHDRQRDVYFYGPATAENVGQVLPVGLGCRDLAHVLLGGAPHELLGEFGSKPTMAWDGRKGQYRLEWKATSKDAPAARATIHVRHGDWRVPAITTWNEDGEKRYVYSAESFEKIEGMTIPSKRQFVVRDTGEDFSLTGGEVQLDPELPEILFTLVPPAGSPVSYIGPANPPPPPPVEGNLCGG